MKGTVKWFNPEKGYGFLIDDESGKDVFVHYSSIKADGFKTLNTGDIVDFEYKTDEKTGKQAAGEVVVVQAAEKKAEEK